MGVTSTSLKLIERTLQIIPVRCVMELDAQNLYDQIKILTCKTVL